MKSTIDQNIDIGYLKITSIKNAGVLQIGTSGIVKPKKGVFPVGPTSPLFLGAPAPHVPLRRDSSSGAGQNISIRNE